MNPSRPFIMRPVATSLVMVALLLSGLVGFRFLPLSALPEVDYPTIQVQTSYPGASPEVMGALVTAPLERQFGQMTDLKRMSSVSSAGASVITLQFNLAVRLDVAEQEVQAAINAAGSLLPADLPGPPVYAKVNPADAPILTLALTSDTLPLTRLQDLADTQLGPRLAQTRGVGLVTVAGGNRPAIRIQADMNALAAYGLSMEALRNAVVQANANGAKGQFDGPTRSYAIDANDQLVTADDYAGVILAYRNGGAVRVRDVARVVQGAENVRLGAWMNTRPAIVLNVQRQPGANVIATVDRIKAGLPEFAAGLPAGATLTLLTDRTTSIRASVRDVEGELLLAVALVVLVMFLFLRSVPATFVASVAVPLSLVGAFGAMYLLGYSLNNLTLMALTIATGFVVDDAIVMIENIARHVEAGRKPLDAALVGARQIGFTIISLTVSLIAVFIPLLFMGDVVGRLFREFAVTLSVTVVLSAVVSLTLVPMLSARWLKPEGARPEGRLARVLKQTFDRVLAAYDRGLQRVLARQGVTLAVAVGTLVLTAVLYLLIPKGLFPTQDTGLLRGFVEADQTVSYARMVERQTGLAAALLKDPAVESLTAFVGVDGENPSLNTGRLLINLKPRAERQGSQAEVLDRLTARARDAEGVRLYLQPVQDLTVDAQVGRSRYQFALEGVDRDEITTWSARLADRLRRTPEVREVASDLQGQGLAAHVELDRDTAARLSITAETLDEALYDAFGQRIVSTIFTPSNQYRVILEAAPDQTRAPDALKRMRLPSGPAGGTPLSVLAEVRQRTAPLQLNNAGQFPAANLSFDTAPGVSLGAAVRAVERAERDIGMPASIRTTFLGAAEAFQASLTNELWLILAAVAAVYIVLGVLYESFVHPITILSTLPSAGVGALLALIVAGQDLGVIGIIGIILLIGIVKKNAIMMIDFALQAEREGQSPREAIHQAALLRFRPILMTTLAALFGALPLMLGWGEGSELRRPLGISIVGGLAVSQLLTLFTTPVVYLAFDRLARRLERRREGGAGEPNPAPS